MFKYCFRKRVEAVRKMNVVCGSIGLLFSKVRRRLDLNTPIRAQLLRLVKANSF